MRYTSRFRCGDRLPTIDRHQELRAQRRAEKRRPLPSSVRLCCATSARASPVLPAVPSIGVPPGGGRARGFCCLHHGQPDTVLDGPRGVHVLQLQEQPTWPRIERTHLDKRGVTDQFNRVATSIHEAQASRPPSLPPPSLWHHPSDGLGARRHEVLLLSSDTGTIDLDQYIYSIEGIRIVPSGACPENWILRGGILSPTRD